MESKIDTFCKFAEAFPRNRNKYLNYTLLLVHERSVVEDLVNDSFAKMWAKREEIDNTNIEAYFYTTIKTVCLDWLRHKAIQYKVHQQIHETSYSLLQYDIASLEAFDPNPIFSNEIREIMRERLKTMPELTAKIFMDSRFSNLSHEEIAGKYRVNKLKVKREIQSVLSCLRISLQDYLPLMLAVSVFGLTVINIL